MNIIDGVPVIMGLTTLDEDTQTNKWENKLNTTEFPLGLFLLYHLFFKVPAMHKHPFHVLTIG